MENGRIVMNCWENTARSKLRKLRKVWSRTWCTRKTIKHTPTPKEKKKITEKHEPVYVLLFFELTEVMESPEKVPRR